MICCVKGCTNEGTMVQTRNKLKNGTISISMVCRPCKRRRFRERYGVKNPYIKDEVSSYEEMSRQSIKRIIARFA